MIEGRQYLKIVGIFYSFLEAEFGFDKINESIQGNAFYDVEYRSTHNVVSISYENVEDHLEIIVFKLLNGKMSDYDDKTQTFHLKHLSGIILPYVSKDEINSNAQYFAKFRAKDELERALLNGAKGLRLCLKYFAEIIQK